MKYRNPIFVAAFPYSLLVIGYGVIYGMLGFADESKELESSAVFPTLGALVIILIGAGYSLFWQIETARQLRKLTDESIPPAILLIIPFANYWWIWRYGTATEKLTRGKIQGVLAFVLIVLLGPIGMGILQDYYNKLPETESK